MIKWIKEYNYNYNNIYQKKRKCLKNININLYKIIIIYYN